MLKKINKIFEMLNENNTEDIQKKGIEEGLEIGDISNFIQPIGRKSGKCVWENCARIIAKKTDKELEPYLAALLEWLQDSNWPGFNIISKRIKKIENGMIANIYFNSIEKAINQNIDEENYEWLINLLELDYKKVIYEQLSINEKKIVRNYSEKYKEILEERMKWKKILKKTTSQIN